MRFIPLALYFGPLQMHARARFPCQWQRSCFKSTRPWHLPARQAVPAESARDSRGSWIAALLDYTPLFKPDDPGPHSSSLSAGGAGLRFVVRSKLGRLAWMRWAVAHVCRSPLSQASTPTGMSVFGEFAPLVTGALDECFAPFWILVVYLVASPPISLPFHRSPFFACAFPIMTWHFALFI